jgi:hypothetical protein
MKIGKQKLIKKNDTPIRYNLILKYIDALDVRGINMWYLRYKININEERS